MGKEELLRLLVRFGILSKVLNRAECGYASAYAGAVHLLNKTFLKLFDEWEYGEINGDMIELVKNVDGVRIFTLVHPEYIDKWTREGADETSK
jgi:hypothetical protein